MSQFIAIDAGATRTRAGLYDESMSLIREVESGGANPVELGVESAGRLLMDVALQLMDGADVIESIIAGVAGAGKGDFARDLAGIICAGTNAKSVSVCNDIVPILKANFGDGVGVLVIAGTGSSVLAQDEFGHVHLIGGYGSLVGDRGSGYRLGLDALQACSATMDGTRVNTDLLDNILRATECSDVAELVQWSGGALKSDIAALARVVLDCAGSEDTIAKEIISEQAMHLADQTLAAQNRVYFEGPIPIFVHGGLLTGSELFFEVYKDALHKRFPDVVPTRVKETGHGALSLLVRNLPSDFVEARRDDCTNLLPGTERMLVGEKPVDQMSGLEITDWMTRSDASLHQVLVDARDAIGGAIEFAAGAITSGGRIIYLGAGTSGRLGVLDASECPPTFGVSKEQVVGLIAGGDYALRNSIENAEDSLELARLDLERLSPGISGKDFVVGITASGTTPYVWGGLEYAKSVGARTCLLACNTVMCEWADLFILLETGPEMLPGSTRLKAGTATKLALNQISTGAMARCGHIYEGYMVGVKSVNAKLHERTVRIASGLLEISTGAAQAALDAAGGDIKVAVLMVRCDLSCDEATDRLEKTKGHLRDALDL